MRVVFLLVFALFASTAEAAEHPALARARALYNAGNLDEAIASATTARADAASADAAALVIGRAHLERFRQRSDQADLAAAREALAAVRVATLMPRDQIDLQVGLGQALYLGESFGAAAELFDSALSGAALRSTAPLAASLPDRDRLLLLDWWATALDREAQRLPADRRAPLFERIVERMEQEVRLDPGSAPANYWLAAGMRGAGDPERAWHAAVAGWIRATLRRDSMPTLRAELDQLVTTALIPERVRARPAREQQDATASLRAEWESLKNQWK
jgi:tetratricopeptide (TPR) repeat protein